MDLFRNILRALNYEDPYEYAEKNKANFGKMIAGERPFKEEYIPYLERFLETTYDYLVFGNGKESSFKNKGIRYAAYTDNIEDYQELLSETNSRNQPLFNFDEFDKTILDYVIEYRAKTGLSYLINNDHISLYFNGKDIISRDGKSINGSKTAKDVMDLIIEKDAAELFEKFTAIWNRYEGSPYELGILKEEYVISKILCAENIFKSLLKERQIPLNEINRGLVNNYGKGIFCNPLLYYVANYALLHEKEYPDQLKQLLEFGIQHNREVIEQLKKSHQEEDKFILDEKGYIKLGRTIYGSMFFYKLDEQPDLSESNYRLLNDLNSIINDFKFGGLALNNGYSKSPVRLENGLIIKKTTANETEYRFFDDMKNKGLPFIPRLEKQENGLDYFSYFQGQTETMVYEQNPKRIKNIVESLKKLNDVSKSILGDEHVYVHDDLSPLNVVFNKDDVIGIIDWDGVKVGEEYEDLVYVMWTWLNIGSLTRDNEKIFEGVKNILEIYEADDNFKLDWADKMIEVMEKRLSKSDKAKNNYQRIFTWVRQSEIWVELYRDRIKEEIG